VQEERVLVRALVRGLQLSGLVPVLARGQVREQLWALRRWHHRSQGQRWRGSKSCCASIRRGCFSRLHRKN
ncbi:MAG: hypothetical protein RLZ89_2114, partial [Pseudomonadota bacterium]